MPAFGDESGYSLDVMRHDPEAQNGVTEYVIAKSADALRERGVKRLSMNFAAWGRLFHAEGELSRRERVGKWVVDRLNPFFQIQSLHDFNAEVRSGVVAARDRLRRRGRPARRSAMLYASVEGFLEIPVVGKLLVPPVRQEAEAAQVEASG